MNPHGQDGRRVRQRLAPRVAAGGEKPGGRALLGGRVGVDGTPTFLGQLGERRGVSRRSRPRPAQVGVVFQQPVKRRLRVLRFVRRRQGERPRQRPNGGHRVALREGVVEVAEGGEGAGVRRSLARLLVGDSDVDGRETVRRLPEQVGRELHHAALRALARRNGRARGDGAELAGAGRDSQPLLQAARQMGYFRPLRAGVGVRLVQNQRENPVIAARKPLSGGVENRAFDGANQHVLQHGVVGYENIGRRGLHVPAAQRLRTADGGPVAFLAQLRRKAAPFLFEALQMLLKPLPPVLIVGPPRRRRQAGVHAEVDEIAVQPALLPLRRPVQRENAPQSGHLVVHERVHRIQDNRPQRRVPRLAPSGMSPDAGAVVVIAHAQRRGRRRPAVGFL